MLMIVLFVVDVVVAAVEKEVEVEEHNCYRKDTRTYFGFLREDILLYFYFAGEPLLIGVLFLDFHYSVLEVLQFLW